VKVDGDQEVMPRRAWRNSFVEPDETEERSTHILDK